MTDHSICLAMIEHIEDYAILYLDRAGNIQNWHKGAEKLHGYTTAEAPGKNFRIFYTDADKESGLPENILREAVDKGRYQHEGWKIRKDDTRYWGNTIITAHYDNQNNVTGFTKITHDLTDKRRLQEKLGELNKQLKQEVKSRDRELAQSEEKYKLLFAANPLPMWLFDLKTFQFLDVNDIACSHYGYSRQEFLSMSVLDIRTDEHKKLFVKAEHPSKLPAQDYNRGIWQHVKKDGTRIYVEVFGHDIIFEERNARIVSINDITNGKLAEEKLKDNQIKLQRAQEMAHFGHWTLDFAAGKALWSDEACRIYGLDTNDNIQSYEGWRSFIHPEDLDYVMNKSLKAQETFSPAEFYHRICLNDGSIKYLFSQSQFEFDATGKPTGMYGVAHDVTDQKIAEEKIINANRLYSFISGINQLIVHVDNEKTLFEEACHIATTLGNFNLAWIGLVDIDSSTLHLLAHSGANRNDLKIIKKLVYDREGPIATVLKNESYIAVNRTNRIPGHKKVNQFALERNLNSFIVLPIKKDGAVYATLSLFSDKENLFDSAEIALLEEVAGDISFALEVFGRKLKAEKAERELQHKELRLNQAQSIAHVGSWELDFSEGVAIWSDEHCRIYGLRIENNRHTFESWLSFIHPDDIAFVREAISGSGKSFEPGSFHHRIVRRDGSIRHIYMHSQYDLNDQGFPVGLYGVSHDVSESKAIELSLTQSEANLRLIMDLLPQSIFIKDTLGRYRFVNKSYAALYGLNPKELVNASKSGNFLASKNNATFSRDDQQVISDGITKIIPEELFIGPTGDEKIFHTTKMPYLWGREREKGVLGILNDITEQKHAELDRNKLIADITTRNENLEQFTYITSHNLRAPVANIIGISELLLSIERENAEETQLMEYLSLSIRKLDEVIKDLNEILQTKHLVTEKKEMITFSGLCKDILSSIDNLFQLEDVTISTDFSATDKFFGIKGFMYSIFFNLISNSIKYRRVDKPLIIEIYSELKDSGVELIFKDNGLGMDLDRMKHQLFGLYKRFHTHIEGKGMGLYMVKTHAEMMGGNIIVESGVNKGTTFKIVFN